MNAITLIKQQHREVERLFKQIEQCEDGDGDEIRRLFADLADDLAAHAEMEEELFYPEVKQRDQEGMIQIAVQEHFEMKRYIAQLLDMDDPLSSEFVMVLAQLKDAVLSHVEEEEAQMLPTAQKLFAKGDLDSLGEEMEARFEQLKSEEPRFEVRDQLDAPAQV